MSARRMTVCMAAIALIAFALASRAADDVAPDCTFKGLKLWGNIEVVESFPDIKVQIVTSFPDLKVQVVESFPDKCGKWKFVKSFPDLKVQFVESFPDVKILYVESFPGLP